MISSVSATADAEKSTSDRSFVPAHNHWRVISTIQTAARAVAIVEALAVAASLSGCRTNCAADDYSCMTSNVHLYQQGDFTQIATAILASGAFDPSKSSGHAPTITGFPGAMSPPAGEYPECNTTFTDASGCRPGGCFSVHAHNSPPGPFWFVTNPIADQQTSGMWKFDVGFDFDPGATQKPFDLTFLPIAPAGPCTPGFDLPTAIAKGTPLAVGAPATAVVTLAGTNYSCNSDQQSTLCPDGNTQCCSVNQVCCRDAANGGAIGCQFAGFCE